MLLVLHGQTQPGVWLHWRDYNATGRQFKRRDSPLSYSSPAQARPLMILICLVYFLQTTTCRYLGLTTCIPHLLAEVTHWRSFSQNAQKHTERSWVHHNSWLHSHQQIRSSCAFLLHCVSGDVAYCLRDDIFRIQLPCTPGAQGPV